MPSPASRATSSASPTTSRAPSPRSPADAPGFDAVKTGIAATERELTTVLGRHGVTRVVTDGAKLDPNRHQAMLEVETDDHDAGSIVAELQPGYTIKDRLLRPALVSVAKRKASGE